MSYLDNMDEFEHDFAEDDFEVHPAYFDPFVYQQPIRRGKRRYRCCVYRHITSGRIRKICQSHGRCSTRLGLKWVLIDSHSVSNCRHCL